MARKFAAEALGTALLVFFGVGVATLMFGFGFDGGVVAAGVVATALAFGLVLLALAYAIGPLTGCHVNPAVTMGALLAGRLPVPEALGYWAAQFAGGILASLVLLVATSRAVVATTANRPVSSGTGFTIELVGTAIFVTVILQASRSERFGTSALIAIPLTLVSIHLVAIPFTGCSVNPARSLGPDLVGDTWHGLWLFFVAPGLGAAVAWVVHSTVVAGRLEPESPVAHVLDEPTSGA